MLQDGEEILCHTFGRRSSDLYWDAGLDPVLALVAVERDGAVVRGRGQQEDDGQHGISTRDDGEAEQEEDSLLERAPGPQKRQGLLVVLHFTGLSLFSIPVVLKRGHVSPRGDAKAL